MTLLVLTVALVYLPALVTQAEMCSLIEEHSNVLVGKLVSKAIFV